MTTPSATVLVVDDEAKLRALVRDYLERDGYTVQEASEGRHALDLARAMLPDLVILDLGLPGLPGEEVARLLRKTSDIPIVVLTARASENEMGLRLGADDYVVKPFSPRELVARVEAVLRRYRGPRGEAEETAVSYGDGRLRINAERREVHADGQPAELTRTEFDLLAALASRPGRAWTRMELVGRVQGHTFEAYERTIDVHVKNLRRKLGDTPPSHVVVTVSGVGYKLGLNKDA
ncbi:response regulator transcription factor [Streptomyces sp. MMS24-I2-30]|uniref:response regulator transcription factor n=1 Tax=Streptomyces sp. MMS24-I2-30 TaxID=3351564 RepID=UPI003896AC8F